MATSRPIRLLLAVAFVDSIGTGLFLAGAAIFYVRGLGIPATQVGIILSAAALVGLVTTVPLAGLADRWGARVALVTLQTARAGALIALAFATDVVMFGIVCGVLSVIEGPVTPVTQAVIGLFTDPSNRSATLARVRVVRNMGFALGSFAALPVLASADPTTFRLIVLGNAASYLLMAVLLLRLPDITSHVTAADRQSTRGVWTDLAYVRLTAVHSVLSLHMTVLAIGLPVWITMHTDVSPSLAAVLVTTNTVLAVAFQMRFAAGVEREGAAGRVLRRAGFSLATSAVLIAVSGVVQGDHATVWQVVVLVAAAVALTAGELWHGAGAWEVSFAGAPEHRRSQYLSFFSLGGAAQEVVGPMLLTGVVVAAGAAGWAGLAVLFVVVALLAPRVAAGAVHPRVEAAL